MARFNGDDEFDSENILERIARSTTNQGKAHEMMRAGREIVHRDPAKAIIFYEEALDLFESDGDMTGAAYATIAIGFAHSHRGAWAPAAVAYGKAIDFARTASRSDIEIDSTFFKGRCHRNVNDIGEAANLMGHALTLAVEVTYPFQGIIRLEYGRLLRKMGRNEDALEVLEPAIEEARENDHDQLLAGAHEREGCCAAQPAPSRRGAVAREREPGLATYLKRMARSSAASTSLPSC